VGCPDILWISVEDHPEWSGRREVEANGCIDLGTLGGVRVEGLTVPAIQERLAALAHVPVAAVNVGIDEYCSQQVYLFGEVTGLQRAVAYQGPETITDLLRRVGGITEDSAPAEVRVVRNTRLEQAEAEVYRVDLRAILMDGDLRTNLTLQPYDQIYVPENKQAKVGRCLHPWLRPVGRALCPDS
jgi:protein involved in polysaccharide export with SLBB domain